MTKYQISVLDNQGAVLVTGPAYRVKADGIKDARYKARLFLDRYVSTTGKPFSVKRIGKNG